MIKLLCVDAKGVNHRPGLPLIKEGSTYTLRTSYSGCICGVGTAVVTLEEAAARSTPMRCKGCFRKVVFDGPQLRASRFIQLNDPDFKEMREEEKILVVR